MGRGPVSVVLPADLRRSIAREAARRELKLSTALRLLAAERLQQIEAADQLGDVERFQRAQAWTAWEELQSGRAKEATMAEVDAVFASRLSQRKRRRPAAR